jgi:hypothetical protein
VNTNHIAALGTGPLGRFDSNELPYAEFPDVLKILNHAHPVLGSVTHIQMFETGTRKDGATEAVFESAVHDLLAVLNSAGHAGCRFMLIVSAATRTCFYVLISSISTTQATVHVTRSNQRCAKRFGLYRASWCHIRISAKAESNPVSQRTAFSTISIDEATRKGRPEVPIQRTALRAIR